MRQCEPSSAAATWSPYLPFALVATVTLVAYGNSLANGLPLDARALVLGNPALRALTWQNLRAIVSSDYWSPMATNGLYRPLTTLSFLANWTLLGNAARPLGYHVVNVLLHVCCAGLVLLLFRRLGLTAAAATIATLAFAVHPVTTEVVANVAGRADLLAALGVVGGVLCHARARESAGKAQAAWEVALLGATAVGVFSKENAAVLLPLVVAWDATIPPRAAGLENRLRGPVLVGSVILVMLIARAWVRAIGYPPEASPLDNPLLDAGFWSGRATALAVLAQQAGTLAWPLTLRADYSYDQIPLLVWPPDALAAVRIGIGTGLLVMLAIAAWRTWRSRPALAFLLVWILVTVFPTANLVLVIGSIRAERFLYLPLIGCAGAITVAAWGDGSARRRRLVCAFGGVVILLCAARTVWRNADWRDDLTLWRATVATSPRNAKARHGLGAALAERGSPSDREQAIRETEAAVAIRPDYLQAWVDLGGYYLALGDAAARSDERTDAYRRALAALQMAGPLDHAAARHFRRAMRAWGRRPGSIPDYGNSALHKNLVVARARLRHWHGVLAAARRLQRLDPWQASSHVDASVAQVQLSRLDDAAVSLHEAVLLGGGEDAADRLIAVYRAFGDAVAGALTQENGRWTLSLTAPLVRRHRCRGLSELARLFDDAALPGEAQRFAAMAHQVCAP